MKKVLVFPLIAILAVLVGTFYLTLCIVMGLVFLGALVLDLLRIRKMSVYSRFPV